MYFRRKRKEKIEITMTPMIDVVFLLLIFFMVTTTFDKETALNINLPEADGSEPDKTIKVITLMIDADGVYYLTGEDGLPHELVNQKKESLKRELMKLSGYARSTPFVIKADEKTSHGSVITALEMAGQVGFKHITFSNTRPGQ